MERGCLTLSKSNAAFAEQARISACLCSEYSSATKMPNAIEVVIVAVRPLL